MFSEGEVTNLKPRVEQRTMEKGRLEPENGTFTSYDYTTFYSCYSTLLANQCHSFLNSLPALPHTKCGVPRTDSRLQILQPATPCKPLTPRIYILL